MNFIIRKQGSRSRIFKFFGKIILFYNKFFNLFISISEFQIQSENFIVPSFSLDLLRVLTTLPSLMTLRPFMSIQGSHRCVNMIRITRTLQNVNE